MDVRGYHLVKVHLHQSSISLLLFAFTTWKYTHMLLVEVIIQTVNVSWKVAPQTAKVSCQEKCRNGSATCCLNHRIALLSVAQIQGNNVRNKYIARFFFFSSHRTTPVPYLQYVLKCLVMCGFHKTVSEHFIHQALIHVFSHFLTRTCGVWVFYLVCFLLKKTNEEIVPCGVGWGGI